jgi:sugar (pentulose or hexulose) kinase
MPRHWSWRTSRPSSCRPWLTPTAVLPLSGDLGLEPGTPVVVGARDGPLANLGLGAVTPGVAACSIDTSGAIRAPVPEPRIDEAGSLFCYVLTGGRWVAGGATNSGGAVLEWLSRVFGVTDEVLLRLAELAGLHRDDERRAWRPSGGRKASSS